MKALEIKKDIFWIGAVDFASHNFHGYSLSPKGTTYNCYVVKDEKNVLFDTVPLEFAETMCERLKTVLEPTKIDYIVINHVELDHAGALAKLVEYCQPEKIFCSTNGLKSMQGYFNTEGWPIQTVKTGDQINIGKRNIHFIETPMIHWPDSMLSYIPEDKLLISNDAFGQNIASSERYVDEISRVNFERAVEEYYYNIILPISAQVLKALDLIAGLNLEIDMIAPDHGLILRTPEDIEFAISKYREMALQKPKKKALILYDTMWGSTADLANAVAQGLDNVGVPYRIMYMKNHHHSEIVTELASCSALLVGSPTHNNGIMPLLAGALAYIKGLKPKNRIGGAFGSFGWSGESIKSLNDSFNSMGFDLPHAGVKCTWRPTLEANQRAEELGEAVGTALLKKIAEAQ